MTPNYQALYEALLKDQQELAIPVAISKHMAKIALFELKGIDALYPDFKDKIVQLMANMKAQGKEIYLTEGFRTAKRQNDLFVQIPKVTNAKGLQSYHQYGLAADFAFINYNFNPPANWWNVLESEAEKLCLISGNNWQGFQDKPHIEWHPNFMWGDLEKYFIN